MLMFIIFFYINIIFCVILDNYFSVVTFFSLFLVLLLHKRFTDFILNQNLRRTTDNKSTIFIIKYAK